MPHVDALPGPDKASAPDDSRDIEIEYNREAACWKSDKGHCWQPDNGPDGNRYYCAACYTVISEDDYLDSWDPDRQEYTA